MIRVFMQRSGVSPEQLEVSAAVAAVAGDGLSAPKEVDILAETGRDAVCVGSPKQMANHGLDVTVYSTLEKPNLEHGCFTISQDGKTHSP